jgi:uncharacterized membrane protein YbhN (UPF0104 family)
MPRLTGLLLPVPLLVALALPAAAVAMGVLGLVVERGLLRTVRGRPMSEILLTVGLSFVAADLGLAVWGGDPITLDVPGALDGRTGLLGVTYPVYRLFVIALGLAVAAGRYEDVRFVAWIEGALVLGTIVFLILIFSRRTGRHLQERVFPLGRRIRLERPITSLYTAMHEYRARPSVLLFVLGMTIVTQLARVVGIWFCGEAVGIDVSPLVYFVLGPLLFFVQMVPFTLNGLGVREAFFVGFLARFDVPEDQAFAAGVLYYAVLLATSLPGAVILLWRSVRPARRVQQET